MSTPPLNEDRAHVLRTPNFNIPAKLGFINPTDYPVKYSMNVGQQEDPPIALAHGISVWQT